LNLNGGWATLPKGVYFNSPQFSITVWIYPQQIGDWSRVIDFGNGCFIDEISLVIQGWCLNSPYISLYDSSANLLNYASSCSIPLITNQWQFLVATFDGSLLTLYIDSQVIVQSEPSHSSFSHDVVRERNFIGKSNCVENGDGYSYSYIDDLRFYNKSLSQSEIQELMNQKETSERERFL
jgi:hypothetical protein